MTHVRAFIEKFRNVNFVGFKPNSRTATPAPVALQEQKDQAGQALSGGRHGEEDIIATAEIQAGVTANEVGVKGERAAIQNALSQPSEAGAPTSDEHATAVLAKG